MAGPLVGFRIIEIAQIAAGPFAGSLLADLGAYGVKAEQQDGGDGTRQWPPFVGQLGADAFSGNFASVNRNKRSIAVAPGNHPRSGRIARRCSTNG